MEFHDYMAQQRPALMRFATVLSGQTWLAEDLIADVLTRAYERWDRIGQLTHPHAYVRRMVVNEYLSWHRRLARVFPRGDLSAVTAPLSDSSERYAERDSMLRRLAKLPAKQRAAVVLRFYLDQTDAEIAAHLGCRESTVRSQISRALAALRIESGPVIHATSEAQ